jgi:hypothetical protein
LATLVDGDSGHWHRHADGDSGYCVSIARYSNQSPAADACSSGSHTLYVNTSPVRYARAIAADTISPFCCRPYAHGDARDTSHHSNAPRRGHTYPNSPTSASHRPGLYAPDRLGALYSAPRRDIGVAGLPLSYQYFTIDACQLPGQPDSLRRTDALCAVGHCHPHAPPAVRTAT